MSELTLPASALLSLLQWSDSLFPSGAFAHSFGLESAVDKKKVQDGKELSAWIRAKLMHQVFPCDLVFLAQANNAAKANDAEAIQKIDAVAHAMRLPREIREGAGMIAARMLQTGSVLYEDTFIQSCLRLLSKGQLKGDPAVALGIVAVRAEMPLAAASFAYLYMFISGQVSASLRLLPIGQQEGQAIIHELLTWSEKSEELKQHMNDPTNEPMSFMPASEIASMQHETSKVRLFQS